VSKNGFFTLIILISLSIHSNSKENFIIGVLGNESVTFFEIEKYLKKHSNIQKAFDEYITERILLNYAEKLNIKPNLNLILHNIELFAERLKTTPKALYKDKNFPLIRDDLINKLKIELLKKKIIDNNQKRLTKEENTSNQDVSLVIENDDLIVNEFIKKLKEETYIKFIENKI